MSVFQRPQVDLLVFTDLDGTLLDHDSYDFAPARPALARLRALHVPVIATTSKTLAELEVLTRELNLAHPCIAENGSLIGLPHGYFSPMPDCEPWGDWCVLRLGPDYHSLLEVLQDLRATPDFDFVGFHDLGDAGVARETGLAPAAAALARRRLCSEPILWQGDTEALERFAAALARHGLRLVAGGRFLHVLGRVDKAAAMAQLVALYAQHGLPRPTTVALGDSPNDLDMLAAADHGILVRHKDGGYCDSAGHTDLVHEGGVGPAGWNSAVTQLLAQWDDKTSN
jgi:mannosyl-3-phosphoglycerate phosphatase